MSYLIVAPPPTVRYLSNQTKYVNALEELTWERRIKQKISLVFHEPLSRFSFKENCSQTFYPLHV